MAKQEVATQDILARCPEGHLVSLAEFNISRVKGQEFFKCYACDKNYLLIELQEYFGRESE